MRGINKAMIGGNLGADPELRQTQNGTQVTNLRVATTKKYKDKEDTLQEKTTWHRITVWGAQAENCAKYLKKGSPVLIEGEICHETYTDKEGVERTSSYVKATEVTFLGSTKEEKAA